MRIVFIFLSISLLLSCQTKKETDSVLVSSKDSISLKNIEWINDSIGIVEMYRIQDTVIRKDDALFAYGSNIKLPKLVSKTGDFDKCNAHIKADWDSIVQKAQLNPKEIDNEYHKIDYEYFISDSIVTVKVTEQWAYHLSEGISKYSIYHFDYKNDQILNTKQMLEVYGLSQVPLLNAIAEQCAWPPDHTEPFFQPEWFEIIKWKDLNQLKFYRNKEQQLVVIYPLIDNGIEAEQILE